MSKLSMWQVKRLRILISNLWRWPRNVLLFNKILRREFVLAMIPVVLILASLLNVNTVYAQQYAFPGAEGHGQFSRGGRGGQIIKVTNLHDSGPGSLRNCIDQKYPRICMFEVSGLIEVKSPLFINGGGPESFITIAGQSAPYPGITLRSDPNMTDTLLRIGGSHVIVQHLRVRPGPSKNATNIQDAIEVVGGSDIILDHLSVSWGTDETLSTWHAPQNVSIQNSIVSEGLFCSTHTDGCHSKGLLVGGDGSKNISVIKNLIAHQRQRLPLIKTEFGSNQVVNNFSYNPEWAGSFSQGNYGRVKIDYVNNIYKQGPNTRSGNGFISVDDSKGNQLSVYLKGNELFDQDNSLVYVDKYSQDVQKYQVSTPHNLEGLDILSVAQASGYVLDNVGANMQLDLNGNPISARDIVDQRVIHEARTGTGRIIDGVGRRCWQSKSSQNQLANGIGYPQRNKAYCLSLADYRDAGLDVSSSDFDSEGWPKFANNRRPDDYDSDGDGLYDSWERRYFGALSTSAHDDPDNDGYSNIEELLNLTDPGNASQVVPQPTGTPVAPTFPVSKPTPAITASPFPTQVQPSPGERDSCGDMTQEAEDGELFGEFMITENADASGNKFVYVPDGVLSRITKLDQSHRLVYCFDVAQAGRYGLDARVNAINGKTDTFYVQINELPESGYIWQIPHSSQFETHSVVANPSDTRLEFELQSGKNTVSFFLREDGAKLDSISLVLLEAFVPSKPTATPEPTSAPTQPPTPLPAEPSESQTISGELYVDSNGNGVKDPTEQPLAGVIVLLVDFGSEGQVMTLTTTSNPDGRYVFTNIPSGDYIVSFALPPQFTADTDLEQISVRNLTGNVVLPSVPVQSMDDQVYLPLYLK